jgi:hypothetical protein
MIYYAVRYPLLITMLEDDKQSEVFVLKGDDYLKPGEIVEVVRFNAQRDIRYNLREVISYTVKCKLLTGIHKGLYAFLVFSGEFNEFFVELDQAKMEVLYGKVPSRG